MSGLLDTNIIVRYLTGDPPDLYPAAQGIIDGDQGIQVNGVVLAEVGYVLTSLYRLSRAAVVDQLVDFLGKRNIDTLDLDKAIVQQALLLCRPSGRVSFADALTWAAALRTDHKVVYTLDERFPSDGIEVRRSRSTT